MSNHPDPLTPRLIHICCSICVLHFVSAGRSMRKTALECSPLVLSVVDVQLLANSRALLAALGRLRGLPRVKGEPLRDTQIPRVLHLLT